MPDPRFTRSDPCSIRAAASEATFPEVARRMLRAGSYQLADDGPLAPLTRDAARSPVHAGLPCTTGTDTARFTVPARYG